MHKMKLWRTWCVGLTTIATMTFAGMNACADADSLSIDSSFGGVVHAQTVPADQVIDPQGIPVASQMLTNWPNITAQSAVVMDLNTGTVIYAKDPLAQHYPASITKILTAKIALDRGQLTDLLTTSENAVRQDGNRVYLVAGEVTPLLQLLYGLLLNSGNDAAVVIAEHYGESIQGFAQLMNDEAKRLGAVHSHFANPNGLPNPDHYTTAYDMAVITRAAMSNPEFAKIVATRQYPWHGSDWDTTLVNENSLLFTYPGAIGVKTGYTEIAHETLVAAAERGNDRYLVVLLDSPLRRNIDLDAKNLLNFAFAHYDTQLLVQPGEQVGVWTNPAGQTIPLESSNGVVATELRGYPIDIEEHVKTVPIYRSVPAHSIAGFLSIVNSSGARLASTPLLLTEPVKVKTNHSLTGIPFRFIALLLLGVIMLALVLRLYLNHTEKSKSLKH